MKNIFFLVLIQCFISSCGTSRKIKESRALLKEYAYCSCVVHAFEDSAFFSKDVSISIYADLSHYPFSALDTVDEFSKRAAMEIKPSIIADHENNKAVFFNCFMFYHSKQLDSLVKSLDKEISRGW